MSWGLSAVDCMPRCRRLGPYKNQEKAARAYDDKKRDMPGARGGYNFPREGEQKAGMPVLPGDSKK